MNIEIERKYLVDMGALALEDHKSVEIKQGFLNKHPKRTVRVRVTDKDATITVKANMVNSNSMRLEIETDLPRDEGMVLLGLIEDNVIHKTRHYIKNEKDWWEVDVYHGNLDGLVIAELELGHEDQQIELPSWIVRDVTDNPIFKSAFLCTVESYEDLGM